MYTDHTVTFECVSTDPADSPSMCIEEEALESLPPTLEDSVPANSENSAANTSESSKEHVASDSTSAAGPSSTEDEVRETSRDNNVAIVEDTTYFNINVEEHHEGLKTKVANSIKHLLGSDDDLVKFDDN